MDRLDSYPFENLVVVVNDERRHIEELFPNVLIARDSFMNNDQRQLTRDFETNRRLVIAQIRPTERGLTEQQILRLPSAIHNQNDLDKHPTCPICLNEYIVNEKITELNCHHRFHPECINKWLKDSNACPCCRKTITVQDEPQPSTSSGDSGRHDQYQNSPELRLLQSVRQRQQQVAETNVNSQIKHPIVRPVIESNTPTEIIEISSDDEDEDSDSIFSP